MILYQIVHGACWSWILTHRLTVMRDKEAILLADNSHELGFGFERNFDEYVKQGIFSRVILYSGIEGNGLRTEQEIEQHIVKTYDDFFRKNNVDFSTLEAIYTSSDMLHSFGVYLTLKGIHYYFYETIRDLIKLHMDVGKLWLYVDTLKKHGATTGNNPLITPIFYPQSVNPFPPDKEVEYFYPDVSRIPAEDIDKLCALWGFDPAVIPRKNNCLVICSSNWNVGVALRQQSDGMMRKYANGEIPLLYRLMIQLSLDYFLREGFIPVIKWHPIIEIPDAEVNLPDAITINRLIDMSFFDYLIKQNNISFEQFLSYGSSAVTKSDEIEDKNHLRLLAFVGSFHLANRMFAILKMIEKLGAHAIKIVSIDPKWRCYVDAIRIFANVLFGIKVVIIPTEKLSTQGEVVIVVDPVSTIKDDFYTEIAKCLDAVVFFPAVDVTTTPDGIYQNALNTAYMQRSVVKKLLEHSNLPADDEAFNIICTKQDSYTTLRDFQFSRMLKYAKAEISLKPLSQDTLTAWRREEWTMWLNQRTQVKMRVSKVLVTGGGSGIGLAIVKRLLAVGCYVCIADRNVEKLRKAQAELGSNRLSVLQWDVKDIAILPAKLLEASSLLGGYFDGVVQSAGIYRHVFIGNTDPAAWDDIMDINAKAPFFIMQKACQYFQQNHIKGNICNISSCLGDSVRDMPGPYAAASLLCTKFTRSFGKAFAGQGIVVNGVAPGDVQTEMCPRGGARNLLKRTSTPEEIAETVALLLSDKGSAIVAETVLVNYLDLP